MPTTSQTTAPDPAASLSLVKEYFRCVNGARIEELAALFADDARLRVPLSRPLAGRAAIRTYYERTFAAYPEKRFDRVERCYVSPDDAAHVAVDIHFEGEDATLGRSVVFDAVDLFTVRDGAIADLRIFYDSASLLRQLGKS